MVDYPLFNAALPNVIKGHEDPEKLFKRYETLKYHALDRSEWGEYLVTFLDNHDQWQRFAWDAYEEKRCDDKQVIAGIGYLLCALGTACIYYGTEQGFSGHGDKFEFVREPLFDLTKDDTSYLNTDCQIYREIAKIAKIHKETAALRFGRMYFRQTSCDKYKDPFTLPQKQPFTLAFSRVLMDQEVLVAYNTSTKDRRNDWIIVDDKLRYRDGKMRFLYGKEGEISVDKHPDLNNHSLCVQLELEPMQFVILINQW